MSFCFLKPWFPGHHVLGAGSREMESLEQDLLNTLEMKREIDNDGFWKVFFNYFNYRASLNADGEGLEENVETCAEAAHPETDKDENHEPDDAPKDRSAVSTSSAIAFACHFLLNWISFFLIRDDPVDREIKTRTRESTASQQRVN